MSKKNEKSEITLDESLMSKLDIFGSGKKKIVGGSVSLQKSEDSSLIGNMLEMLKKSRDEEAVKLSFSEDPGRHNTYASIYRPKTTLVPNDILKRVRDTEELIGGILIPTRSKQVSLFARPRPSRFDIGFEFNFHPHIEASLSDEQKEQLKKDVYPKLREILLNCGYNTGITNKDKRTLTQFFSEITEDILTFGGFAVELRRDEDNEFHSFRAVDTGTIYYATKQRGNGEEAQKLREEAARLLESMDDSGNIDVKRFQKDEYTYVQVIEGKPQQVFTDEEMLFWSIAPSTDIYRNGYPVSPMERILTAITTHINLTTHNKMFFVNGRAAKNILYFKSDNLEEEDINNIRSQMAQHINGAAASWRMPVFGIGPQDEMNVLPLDGGSKDMEFQYLADLNKRMIFAAYQMSPDEVAALGYLSRGTNSQAMSEGNNEYKLEASRDTGIRPLLISIESFLNERLLPLINKEWSKQIQITLAGLDADSPQLEATRLQQDASIFATMNDIMGRVEKEPLPIGGDFPMNPAYLQIIEKYFTKGEILEAFGGEKYKEASKNQDFAYYMGDPVWLQLFQMKQQQAQMQQQMQAQQQQVQGSPTGSDDGQGGKGTSQQQPQDMDTALAQLEQSLSKNEKNLPENRKEMLKRMKLLRKNIVKSYEKDAKSVADKILSNLEKGGDAHICTEDCEHVKKN